LNIGIPDEQIGDICEEVFAKVEAHHGKKFTHAVRGLLTNFVGMTMAESTETGIPPGRLISGFMMILLEIDKRSDELALRSGDCRKN
jgi:hypothetical protein